MATGPWQHLTASLASGYREEKAVREIVPVLGSKVLWDSQNVWPGSPREKYFRCSYLQQALQTLHRHCVTTWRAQQTQSSPKKWQMLFLGMKAFSHKQTALCSEEPALLRMSGKQRPFQGQYFKMNRRKTGLLVWRASLLSSCNTCLKTARTRQWINNHSLDQTVLCQVKYCTLLLTQNVSTDGGLCGLCCGHTECLCFAKNTTVLTDW